MISYDYLFVMSSCARLKHFDGPWPNASPAVGREWIPAETCASGHAAGHAADASRVAFVVFVSVHGLRLW